MKLTTVTRASQISLVIAELLFLVFLASPTFIDSVTSDGTVTMLPGYGAVVWCAVVLPSVVVHSRRDAAVLVPIFLTHVAFIILPVLVLLRHFRAWVLRVCFSLLFVAGFVSMAEIIGDRSVLVSARISGSLQQLLPPPFVYCHKMTPDSALHAVVPLYN